MLVIYKSESSSKSEIFYPSAICRWKPRMENSEEASISEDANLPMRKKMRLWNPKIIKLAICVLTPFLLSPLAFSSDKAARCGFVILWMAIFWMLEPVSITVTALLPVPLMPLLGILDIQEVTRNYMKEVLLMFLGGLGMAIAVEHSNLHERIALKILLTVGANTKWLMLGFMSTSMFLSMWISNTATAALMVPIIDAMMDELHIGQTGDEEKFTILHKALLLSIAYSANTGGTGTITGTSPNMILKGYLDELYPESNEITYASWMAYNVPTMILVVLSAWFLLQVMYIPCWGARDRGSEVRIRSVIMSRYNQLGGITFHEAAVLSLFILVVLLWFFRDPEFIPGWAEMLPVHTKIGDAVPAIGVFVLLFLLPAEPWKLYNSRPLLTWKVTQDKMPWGLIILLGGGYALGNGAQKSGLSKWLGETLSGLSYLPSPVILVILWLITTSLTEIMSNSAVTMLIPIVNEMALASDINPLYFMLPVTVIASQAYMLPVATGPNAIVFRMGTLTTAEMIKPGLVMNLLAGCIQLFMVNTYGSILFNLDVNPDWAISKNVTLIPNVNITAVPLEM